MKPFDRFIAAIQQDPDLELRVRATNWRGPALVHVDLTMWTRYGAGFYLTPDEALSLAAFLRDAVAAIKQEGDDG